MNCTFYIYYTMRNIDATIKSTEKKKKNNNEIVLSTFTNHHSPFTDQ